MAPRAESRQTRSPRRRLAGDGLFFPNEVVRILGLERIDYRQLRRLFRLVRIACGGSATSKKWARFSFTELAALRVAIELAGGVEGFKVGCRLRLKPIEDACLVLRERYGIDNPLLQACLRRRGDKITVAVNGVEFAPVSGQLVLNNLLEAATKHVLVLDALAVRNRVTTKMRKEQRAMNQRCHIVGTAERNDMREIAVVGERR